MTSRGAVPGSTAVKQEGNISREVSQGPDKRGEQHAGRFFPSMQHRTENRSVQDNFPEPPCQPVISHEVQSKMFCTTIPTMLDTFE